MAIRTAPAHDDRGSGAPVVVLVHGHPFDHRMWTPQLETLAACARVVAPDLPGYGRSAPIGSKITMREPADAVLALLDDLARFSGVGHLPDLEAPERFDAAVRAFAGPAGGAVR